MKRAFFSGSIALVSGGSRGLGFEIARQLARQGAKVTIAARGLDALTRAREQLSDEGLAVDATECDVRDREAVNALVASTIDRYGRIDLVVNDAGVIEVGPLADQGEADYREAIETHLFGPLHVIDAVLPSMRARRHGRIVNVASIGGIVGVPHLAPYSASKFALVGYSQAACAELARDGIALTCVCPGLMRTGSPDHAIFKGRHRAEYAWFTLSDSNPLISMSADRAASRIIDAARRKTPILLLGWPTRIASIANGLVPNLVSKALQGAAALLPSEGGVQSERRTGAQSHSPWAPSVLTFLDTLAKRRYNQGGQP